MDFAVFSPRKPQQMLNQSSPKLSAHKRKLFPSSSPQNNDLGLISELSSDYSDTYSPSPPSPSSSTPEKNTSRTFGRVLQISNYSEFGNSPPQKNQPVHRGSSKMLFDKENIPSAKKLYRKRQNKYLGKDNFEANFDTILQDSSEDDDLLQPFKFKNADGFITPKKTTLISNKFVKKSPPHSSHKYEVTIKPNSFYGNIAPVLATNQSNRTQGKRDIFRPAQPSKAKAKLLFEEKPAKKRERSKSLEVMRESKKRKSLFTGVNHAIPKRMKLVAPPEQKEKRESLRDKAIRITDFSRTPYGMKKTKKDGWEYTLRFTKPLRYEEDLGPNRKFFKTSLKESPSVSVGCGHLSPSAYPKKRKLLDSHNIYLEENSPPRKKPQMNVSDISDMISDLETDKSQDLSDVDNILLRLEEDDSEEKKREAEKQMLMNILEDSPNKTMAIDSLSNYTASLDLNTSSDSGCSRFSLESPRKDKGTRSKHLFPIFDSPSNNSQTDVPNRRSSSKKKWNGVGLDQMQIDAGQKKFGACQCNECGMIYQRGEAEDETQHNTFHNNLTTLRYTSWKNENVVGAFGMEYAVVVTRNDPKSWQQKALEVIALVDKSLGILNESPNILHNQKVFLYLAEKRIVGCMVACPITHAYKMQGSESDVNLCSEESFSVRCGISRMWTLYSHRRRGVASRLLDTVRRNFMYGNILSKEDIAFSIPTPDGKRFAAKYIGHSNFFVYTGY